MWCYLGTGYGYGPNSTHPPYCHCRTEARGIGKVREWRRGRWLTIGSQLVQAFVAQAHCIALGFKFKTHTCQSQVFAWLGRMDWWRWWKQGRVQRLSFITASTWMMIRSWRASPDRVSWQFMTILFFKGLHALLLHLVAHGLGIRYTEGEYAPLIAAAHEAGTCSGFVTSWQQNLKQVLEWPAKMCCRSWPSRYLAEVTFFHMGCFFFLGLAHQVLLLLVVHFVGCLFALILSLALACTSGGCVMLMPRSLHRARNPQNLWSCCGVACFSFTNTQLNENGPTASCIYKQHQATWFGPSQSGNGHYCHCQCLKRTMISSKTCVCSFDLREPWWSRRMDVSNSSSSPAEAFWPVICCNEHVSFRSLAVMTRGAWWLHQG